MVRAWAVAGCLGILSAVAVAQQESIQEKTAWVLETYDYFGPAVDIVEDVLSEPDPTGTLNAKISDRVGALMMGVKAGYLFSQGRDAEAWRSLRDDAIRLGVSLTLRFIGLGPLNTVIAFVELYVGFWQYIYNQLNRAATQNQITFYNACRSQGMTHAEFMARPDDTPNGTPLVWDDRGWIIYYGSTRNHIFPQGVTAAQLFGCAEGSYAVRSQNWTAQVQALGDLIDQRMELRLRGSNRIRLTGEPFAPTRYTLTGAATPPEGATVTGYEWRTEAGALLLAGNVLTRNAYQVGDQTLRGRALFSNGNYNENPITLRTRTPRIDLTQTTDPRQVTFRVHQSPAIQSVSWDFGDGTTGSGITVAKSYEDFGGYIVRATITAVDGSVVQTEPLNYQAGVGGPTRIDIPYTVTGTEVWHRHGSPYILEENVTINPGARLILEEGTVIKFGKKQDANFFPRYINVSGTLEYAGTAQRPVILTSVNDDTIRGDANGDGPGGTLSTGGVQSNNTGGVIEGNHLELRREITHNNNGGQLRLDGARIQGWLGASGVRNLRIERSSFEGTLLAIVGCESPSIIDNTFGGYSVPTTPIVLYYCRGSVEVRGNIAGPGPNRTRPAIQVKYMQGDVRLKKSDWAYLLHNPQFLLGECFFVPFGETLTLDAGVVAKVSDGVNRHNIPIIVDGTLNANGTAQDPVIFAAGNDASIMGDTLLNGGAANASWAGIYSYRDRQVNMRFAHIYRGALRISGNLLLQDSKILHSPVNIEGNLVSPLTRNYFLNSDVLISYGQDASLLENEFVNSAISLLNNGSATISGNVFRDFVQPTTPVSFRNPSGVLSINGNTLGANARPAAQIFNMGGDLRLTRSEWAYLLTGENSGYAGGFLIRYGTTLTLDAGVTVKTSNGLFTHDLPIHVLGSLNAQGTLQDPVNFAAGNDASVLGDSLLTGVVPTPSWAGIQSQTGQQVNLRFTHVHRGNLNSNENISLQDSRLLHSSVNIRGTPTSSVTRNYFLNGGLTIHSSTNLSLLENEFVNASIALILPNSPSITNNIFRDYMVPTTPVHLQDAKGTVTIRDNTLGSFARPAVQVYQMSGDLQLKKSNWAYLLYGENPSLGSGFWVPSGLTLTLDPGVVMKSSNGQNQHAARITVLGKLFALGSSAEPISLLAGNDTRVMGDSLLLGGGSNPFWFGVQGNAAEQLALRNLHVYGGGIWSNSKILLQDSRLLQAELGVQGSPSGSITRNHFIRGSVSFTNSKDLSLTANDFENTTLYLGNPDSLTLTGNTFRAYQSPTTPVMLYNGKGTVSIQNNTLGNNARPAVTVYQMGGNLRLAKSNWAYVLQGWAGTLGEGFLVPSGQRLEVDGGAVVKIGTNTQDRPLFVQGTLSVDALAQSPAVFTDLADDAAAGDTMLDGITPRRTALIQAPSAASVIQLHGAEIRRGAGTWRGLVRASRSIMRDSNFTLHGGPNGSRFWSSVFDRSTFSVGLSASMSSSHMTVSGSGSGLQYIGARGTLRNSIAQFSPTGFLRLESSATQTHNVIWQSGSPGTAFPPNGTEMFLDPLLAPFTYEPLAGSPVIGAGLFDPTARYDLYGRPRIGNGSRGAVEPGGMDPLLFVSLRLADFVGEPSAYPFQVLIRDVGTGTVLFEDEVPVDAAGFFSLPVALAGETEIFVSGRTFLRKRVAFTPSATELLRVELVNGDINGDNEVSASDFSELAAAYDSVLGDANYSDAADLNGDGEVGAADFSILAASYDLVGD